MPPGFDEGRRMTRSARRAHPEPTPEPPEPQESRSSSEESLDIELERNVNIEARIQRLKSVIQSRKDHLRDIFVLYNHRANPGTYCSPEDFMETAPDRSTADPPHLSPLLATLGEWQAETPPQTPPMLQDLPESVLEEDKLDMERLQELVPKPVQATPPPVVVPLPVVVEVDAASSDSDVQDMDIDDSSSPRVKAEPEPEQEPAEQVEQPLAPPEESKESTALPEEDEPLAQEPAAASLDEDSPMTEPPLSPPRASLPPPATRATSVATAHTPAAAASPMSQHASPAPVHAAREPSPVPINSPTPHAPTPPSVPREPSLAAATPTPPVDDEMLTPQAATPAPKSPTPIPSAPTPAHREPTAPAQEDTPLRDSTPTLSVEEPTPAPSDKEPTPAPPVKAPTPAPPVKAPTPAPKDPTPAPKSPTPVPVPREPTPALEEPTVASREVTPVPKARTPAPTPRDEIPLLKEPTPVPRESSPVLVEPTPPPREETPAKDPTPSPSPAAIAQQQQPDSPLTRTVSAEAEPAHDEGEEQTATQAHEDEDQDMSDGTSTPNVEAVLGEDEDAMQIDDVAPADVAAEDVESNATTPRPTTVSPSALEPPPVTRAPAVTFNSALFRPATSPQPPEPHASNAFTSPQRRVTKPPTSTFSHADTTPFDFALNPQPTTDSGADSTGLLVPESDFTRRLALPPLAALPPTFNHTVKPAKLQRKREKEKERKEKEGKDVQAQSEREKEFIPLGLTRWAALVRANPVHKHIKKAAKVLFTADWRLAQDELLFLRAMDRIDRLKQDGLWSFRQPKRAKQPVHIKVHWDYLLDEMKWMRTDFREERKWKVALAYELAVACRTFVQAAPEQRPALCAKYRLRREEPGVSAADEEDEDMVMVMDMDVDDEGMALPAVPPSTPPPELPPPEEPLTIQGWQPPPYGTPDPLGPPSPERLPNYDAETESMAQTYSHLEPAEDVAASLPVAEMINDVAMKTEETDQPLGLGMSAEVDAGDSDEGGRDTAAAAAVDDSAVLKDAGQNPTLGSTGGASSKLGPYKALRDPILALGEDALWIDFDDLQLDDAEREKLPLDGVPLPEIFPELDLYEPLPASDREIAMNILEVKDHPAAKRVDETVSGKLASTSIFMDSKPTLVGALNPAQHWRNGKWVNLDDAVIHPSTVPADDKDWDHHMSDLFKMHGTSATPRNSSIPKMPTNAPLRASELPWTKADDDLLKSIVDRFPNNWHLVAEWFNSSRVTIDMDRRSPWDCCERWHRKFGMASDVPQAEQPRSPSPNLYESSAARGLKRLAGNAAFGTNTEPRKRRRLLHLQDAVRKYGKKRETAQRTASQSKKTLNANVHETHTKIAKSSLSALELTRMKLERDNQERQRVQAQNEALRNAAASAQHPAQRQLLLAHQQQLGLMRGPGQLAQLPGQGMPKLAGIPQAVMPPGMMVNMQQHMQQLSQQQRAQFMRTQQAMQQQAAQVQQAAGIAAAAQAGSSNASPHLQSSSPQTSPPRPGPSGQGVVPRPGSVVPLDPAAFQVAQQQQALHAAMMQGYSNEEQMRQRIGIQNMLAGSNTTGGAPSQGSGPSGAQ